MYRVSCSGETQRLAVIKKTTFLSIHESCQGDCWIHA